MRQLALLVLAGGLLASPAHAQEFTAVAKAVEKETDGLAFQVLPRPSEALDVGGLILPGHERQGAALADEVLRQTGSSLAQSQETSLAQPISLGTLGKLTANLGRPELGKACAAAPVTAVALVTQRLEPGLTSSGARFQDTDQLAQALGLRPADLKGYVVIAGTVSVRLAPIACPDDGAAKVAKAWVETLAWAYQGALPVPVATAVGPKRTLTVLEAFELNAKSPDRTLTVKGFSTDRKAAQVGWIGRVKLGARDPGTLADEAFNWLGPAPTGPQQLWPGRFYFRLRDPKAQRTVQRDLTLSQGDKVISLPWVP